MQYIYLLVIINEASKANKYFGSNSKRFISPRFKICQGWSILQTLNQNSNVTNSIKQTFLRFLWNSIKNISVVKGEIWMVDLLLLSGKVRTLMLNQNRQSQLLKIFQTPNFCTMWKFESSRIDSEMVHEIFLPPMDNKNL